MTSVRILATLVCLALTASLPAATYLVPTDAEMIQRADDIVVATTLSSVAEARADGSIVTRFTLRIEEVLKGKRVAGSHLVLTEPGGRTQIIPAAPRYEPGRRYLVFTEVNERDETSTFGMQLGRFALEEDFALRAGIHGLDRSLEPYAERVRDARGFLEYIRGIVAQRATEANYFSSRSYQSDGLAAALLYPRSSYMIFDIGYVRWSSPAVDFVISGSVPANSITDMTQAAMSEWNGTEPSIRYRYVGRNDSANQGFAVDGINAVQIHPRPGSGNVVGYGGWTNTGQAYTIDGESFIDATEADVIMYDYANMPLTPSCWSSLVAHELGHTLGIRHADYDPSDTAYCAPPLDCSADSVMTATLSCQHSGVLRAWDRRAASTIYAGPCVTPSITEHPSDRTIVQGQSTLLIVNAAGTALSYQWYVGAPPDVSKPIGTDAGSIVVTPAGTTKYWVRVKGRCGSDADSNAATITTICTPPSIHLHPEDQSVPAGQSVTLIVGSDGSPPLSYQWFEKPAGAGSFSPAGTNSVTLTVSPSVPTSYYVEVSNSCGTKTSNVAVVAVGCADTVQVGAPSATQKPDGGHSLSVTASSGPRPLAYTWYEQGLVSSIVLGSGNPIEVPASAVAKSYWVRVHNDCGNSARSASVSVPCSKPRIVSQSPPQSVAKNASVTLSVNAAGPAPLTYTWYEGRLGTTSKPVGTNLPAFTSPPLTESTQFWVNVGNACGEVTSSTMSVQVTNRRRSVTRP